MTIELRILLIFGALLTLYFVLTRIRKAAIRTSDAVFWFVFAGCLVILAVFPQIIFFFSNLLGVQSPANLVFLVIVAILLVKEFTSTVEIAKLKDKVSVLTQLIALDNKDLDKGDLDFNDFDAKHLDE